MLRPVRVLVVIMVSLLATCGVAIGILLVTTQSLPSVPTITRVVCFNQTSSSACSPMWQATVESLIGQPILFSDPESLLSSSVANQGAYLTSYERVWPNQINITLSALPLMYQLQTPTMRVGVLADASAVFLDAEQREGPVVRIDDEMITDGRIPMWLHQALSEVVLNESFVKHAQRSGSSLDMQLVSPVELRLTPDNSNLSFIMDPQEISNDLARLDFLFQADSIARLATISGEVDLRLRLPVLRRLP